MTAADSAVLLFSGQDLPRALAELDSRRIDDLADVDAAARGHRRLIVVGCDADLAAVLTRLLRTEKLDVELGFVTPRRSAATRAYRLAPGLRGARRAKRGEASRVPLIRDDAGVAIVGAAMWHGAGGPLHGEAVVDDATLFYGDVPGVRIEPTAAPPGLRAAVVSARGRPGRWVTGRAAQLGSTGAMISRDGVGATRAATRSTLYRHTGGWLLVR